MQKKLTKYVDVSEPSYEVLNFEDEYMDHFKYKDNCGYRCNWEAVV